MAYELSEIVDPIVADDGHGKKLSPFTERLLELPVGKAFIVKGMARNNVAARISLSPDTAIPTHAAGITVPIHGE